ncbi:putative pumilio homolog 7, chloroplastic isoform X1 [Musa acuminata AAA Group]
MKMGKQEEREMEMLLDEIPHATSPHLPHPHLGHHRRFHGDDALGVHVPGLDELSPVRGFYPVHGCGHGRGPDHGDRHARLSPPPLPSEGSLVLGFLSPAADELARQHTGRMVERLGLLDKLSGMHLGVDPKVPIGRPLMPASASENNPINPSVPETNYTDDTFQIGVNCHSVIPNSLLFGLDKNPCSSQSQQQHCYADANFFEPWLDNFPYGATELGTDGVLGRTPHCRANLGGGFVSRINQPYPVSNMFLQSEKIRIDSSWNRNTLNASRLPDFSVSNGCIETPSANLEVQPGRILRNPEVFGSDDSLIIEGKELHCMRCPLNYPLKGTKLSQFDGCLYARGVSVKLPNFLPKYDNVMDVKGCMYFVAKHQHGCRFLQQKLDEGKHVVDVIFNGVINHASELMIDPFGNYLMQKLLELCSEEQLMQILLVLKDPDNLIRISLNVHGTRAVQKLIDTLKTKKQIALVISAIQPGFLDLIKDLNGSHVLQRCLESFTPEDNKLIFDAAAKHCVDIATHRHGCCVLQKCIAHSTGENQAKLIAEISANGYELAQDPFGNYVVQYILDLKNSLAVGNLASQFEGKYVQLSIQKFSSNVVEKCLKILGEDDRATIILELISVSHFEQLLQDPYANYVIKSALLNSKGPVRAALVKAMLPHEAALRTNPYCKRIFSRALLKK